MKLIEEEHEEWIEEFYSLDSPESAELKELTDILYVVCGLAVQLSYTFDKAKAIQVPEYYDYTISELIEQLVIEGDTSKLTIMQLIYCLFGYAQMSDWNLHEAYKRVHASNMSKLGDDGKPILREDGKVLKGPNYFEPNLEDLTYA